MARKPGPLIQGPVGAYPADPLGSSWWLLPEPGLSGPQQAGPALPPGQYQGCAVPAEGILHRSTVAGERWLTMGERWLWVGETCWVALVGPLRAASLEFWLKVK